MSQLHTAESHTSAVTGVASAAARCGARYIHGGRIRRFRRFVLGAQRTGTVLHILDVGGTREYWSAMPWHELEPVEITLVNVLPQTVQAPFTAVAGDARDLSEFADRAFDLVFSHSVIGHVGGFGDQTRMAREIRRVGRHYVVQTPNQRFPIDWRTLVPAFHWLPIRAQAWCFRHLRVGRYPRVPDLATAIRLASRVRNLTRSELVELFPGARIHCERVAGLTKSFIVTS